MTLERIRSNKYILNNAAIPTFLNEQNASDLPEECTIDKLHENRFDKNVQHGTAFDYDIISDSDNSSVSTYE
jgi:hypothetical protein